MLIGEANGGSYEENPQLGNPCMRKSTRSTIYLFQNGRLYQFKAHGAYNIFRPRTRSIMITLSQQAEEALTEKRFEDAVDLFTKVGAVQKCATSFHFLFFSYKITTVADN